MLSNDSKTKFRIIPIEVKSAKNYSAVSLDEFSKAYHQKIRESYIVHPKNLMVLDGVIKIPPYMFFSAF